MLLFKMYKDETKLNYQMVTDLDHEFEILRATFENVEPLMFDGSEFETNWAWYKVMNERDAENINN